MNTSESVKSILKAVSVLKSFTPQELELSVTDIGRMVGIPKTTAHRVLVTLTECGLLDKNPKTSTYSIGPALYLLGSLYLSTTDIPKAAQPVLKNLNDLTGEAVHVGILDKGNVLLVMKEESRYAFRIASHIGTVLPAYASSMGKALLSELTETELDNLYPEERLRPITEKTITTKTKLKKDLEQIRMTGVSFNKQGAWEGVEGIASVIRDVSGRATAAMAISVPVFRINEANRPQLARLVRLGASLISYRLGYQDKDNPVRDVQEIRSWWEQSKMDLAPVK